MKKVIFLLLMGLIFNSCQKFNLGNTPETPTVTAIEQNAVKTTCKNMELNEFSHKFDKKYTFDNLYIDDYSYDPMLYKTINRPYVKFSKNKVFVKNLYDETIYSFNIDSVMYCISKEECSYQTSESCRIFCKNNKYKNVKMYFDESTTDNMYDSKHIMIILNKNIKLCFENLDPNTKQRSFECRRYYQSFN